MAEGEISPINMNIKFGIRNDKNRGLLVETMETADGNVHFFKHHDQPLSSHCQQLQNIVIAANVRRARKLLIDVTEFYLEYFQASDNTAMFRATKLESVHNQVEKAYSMRLNKEMSIVKRRETMAANKQAKIIEKNNRIVSKIEAAEVAFQAERARRILLLFPQGGNGSGSNGSGSGAAMGGVRPEDIDLPQDDDESM